METNTKFFHIFFYIKGGYIDHETARTAFVGWINLV